MLQGNEQNDDDDEPQSATTLSRTPPLQSSSIACSQQQEQLKEQQLTVLEHHPKHHFVVRSDNDRGLPSVVKEVLLSRGWVEYDESVPPESQPPPNLWWQTNRFTLSQVKSAVYPYHRINHYPRSSEITKKDSLFRHFKRMRAVHGCAALYDFLPITFTLPNEYVQFCRYFSEQRELWASEGGGANASSRSTVKSESETSDATMQHLSSRSPPPPTYIAKPSDMSRGRKIFLFREVHELMYDCPTVVQRYISNPLLIYGHKVDFRVYVLVTSVTPQLRAYVYRDIIGRFGVDQYSNDDITNIFSHLTNYSINKMHPTKYTSCKPGIGEGSKWRLPELNAYFGQPGLELDFENVMMKRAETVILLTLLAMCDQLERRGHARDPTSVGASAASSVFSSASSMLNSNSTAEHHYLNHAPSSTPPLYPQCFELYGFDIMFDENFKPWLLEVNFSPALSVESPVDSLIKRPLVNDMIDTLNIIPTPPRGARSEEEGSNGAAAMKLKNAGKKSATINHFAKHNAGKVQHNAVHTSTAHCTRVSKPVGSHSHASPRSWLQQQQRRARAAQSQQQQQQQNEKMKCDENIAAEQQVAAAADQQGGGLVDRAAGQFFRIFPPETPRRSPPSPSAPQSDHPLREWDQQHTKQQSAAQVPSSAAAAVKSKPKISKMSTETTTAGVRQTAAAQKVATVGPHTMTNGNLKAIMADIRRRETKLIAQMADYPRRYAEFIQASQTS